MSDRDLSGRTLGEFRLRKLIGEGGYGQVYLAEQPALEREVVVKVLREDRSSPGARERFLREARLAAQLRHPYAAQVYAFGAAFGGSLLWIAMELRHWKACRTAFGPRLSSGAYRQGARRSIGRFGRDEPCCARRCRHAGR